MEQLRLAAARAGASAIVSADRRYRYALARELSGRHDGTPTLFVMLNPFTADEHRDDPTIRRCRAFAARWGSDELLVGNLFAWRATDPRELAEVRDPVGPDNDLYLAGMAFQVAGRGGRVVCAWGGFAGSSPRRIRELFEGRARRVAVRLEETAPGRIFCLGRTKEGHPRHPLYIPGSAFPEPFKKGTP